MESKKLTKGQACSRWLNLFTNTFITDKKISEKDIQLIKLDYIKLCNYLPNEDIEKTVISMMKSNNAIMKYFDRDKEKINSEISKYFRKNNSIYDFNKDLEAFIKCSILNNETFLINSLNNEVKKNEKIDKLYNTGVLRWDFVKSKFPSNMDFWKVKEALAWMTGYVENCDYNLDDIIEKTDKGFVNKHKTFDNLVNKVNDSALTKENPFYKKYNNYYFNEAKSGEVDVMLWDQKNKKIFSMSATRDRSYKIEGNQFPRHYIKSIVFMEKLKGLLNKMNVEPTSKNIQKIVRNEHFINFDKKSIAINYTNNEDIIHEINNNNEFAIDLTIVRKIMNSFLGDRDQRNGIDFQNYGLHISNTELTSILSYYDNKVDFVFFGEVLDGKPMNDIKAGLNCLAYRDNFKRIGKFRVDEQASNSFMRTIGKRFNGIPVSEKNIEDKGKMFLIDLISNIDNNDSVIKLKQNFSETNVYNDERSCLFKSFAVLFKNISTELEKSINGLKNEDVKYSDTLYERSVLRGFEFFFDYDFPIEYSKNIKNFFSKDDNIQKLFDNLSSIKTSLSEVPLELEELEVSKDNLINLKERLNDQLLIKQLLNEKNELIQKLKKNEIVSKKIKIK